MTETTAAINLTLTVGPVTVVDPQTIYDPAGQFSLILPPGWRALVYTTTSIYNYDENVVGEHEGSFPPGTLRIEIVVGKLPDGLSFEQWQSEQIARNTQPDPGIDWPGQTATEPQPYTLGRYDGFSYTLNGEPHILKINLPLSNSRVMVVTLKPSDSPALSEGLKILSTLEISSELLP